MTVTYERGLGVRVNRETRVRRSCFGAALWLASWNLANAQGYDIHLVSGSQRSVCQAYVEARNSGTAPGIEKCLIGRPLPGTRISRPQLTAKYLNLTVPPAFEGPAEVQVALAAKHSKFLHEQLLSFSLKHDARLARYFNYRMAASAGWRDDMPAWDSTPDQRRIVRKALKQWATTKLAIYTLPTFQLDIDNDGLAENIFFYLRELPSWNPAVAGTAFGAPIILSADGSTVDSDATLRILRDPVGYEAGDGLAAKRFSRDIAAPDFLSDSHYGFFEFDGKTYFDFALGTDGLSASLPEAQEGIEGCF